MIPPDLPRVAIAGTPARFRREDAPGRGHWEWLRLALAAGGEIALFDPDHACPPVYLGRPCRLAIELFQPAVLPNPERRAALMPTGERAARDDPPVAAGLVLAHHRTEWRYTGPVTVEEERDGVRRRVVRHVIDAPHATQRLVVDVGRGTLLAQLRDPDEVPPVGAWVTLRGGRPELLAIEPLEP